MTKRKLKVGDIVSWTYRHYTNAKSSTLITKKGIITKINETLVSVLFEGNKHPAVKPYTSLTLIKVKKK